MPFTLTGLVAYTSSERVHLDSKIEVLNVYVSYLAQLMDVHGKYTTCACILFMAVLLRIPITSLHYDIIARGRETMFFWRHPYPAIFTVYYSTTGTDSCRLLNLH